jgi:hypothetical protein
MTATPTLPCPKCQLALDPAAFAAGAADCPACRSRLAVRLFPAFTRPPEAVSTASGEHAQEGEAVCFFHPEKRAATSCERCGRFLCALCDVPFGGKHLCPSCLDASKLPDLVNRRVVWGHVALLVGLLPLVPFCWPFWFMALVTGPAAIFLALWKWKAPGSIVHGQRHGLALTAITAGCVQILAIGGIFFAIYYGIRHG